MSCSMQRVNVNATPGGNERCSMNDLAGTAHEMLCHGDLVLASGFVRRADASIRA